MSDPREVLSRDPLNAEAPLQALAAPVTPLSAFYIRSNFATPSLDAEAWRLDVSGAVSRPVRLSRADLEARPRVTRRVTLECAGNGRSLLSPAAPGTPWTLGATGTATFTGTPLAALLDEAGVSAAAVEALFTGADRGVRPDWGEIAFQRSLPVDVAWRDDGGPLLAWAMNGEPLRPEHGAPVRLVVPGWYAVASVKWLTAIHLLTEPFEGHFQTDRYLYKGPAQTPTPVTAMRVRALLTHPDPEAVDADGAVAVAAGAVSLSGVAWSGHGAVAGVRVSTDGGASWQEATLGNTGSPTALDPGFGAAVPWTLTAHLGPGRHEVVVRARDVSGAEQPLAQFWNELGYGNNAVQRVVVYASPSS